MDKSSSSSSGKLRLECGQPIHLQHMNGNETTRQQVKLIGWETGKSLIVKPPSISSWLLLLPANINFVTRLFSGSSAYAFETTMLCIHHEPFDYFHLAYPKKTKSSKVRMAPRVKIDMEVSLTLKDNKVTVVKALDASRSGMAVLGPDNLTNIGDQLKLCFDITSTDKTHSFCEMVVVRNSRPSNDNPSESIFGVEFFNLDREKTLTLSEFLYEQQG
ncbi:MAG: flagellar brake protein [Methylococcaceae bacterium]